MASLGLGNIFSPHDVCYDVLYSFISRFPDPFLTSESHKVGFGMGGFYRKSLCRDMREFGV